MNKKDKVELEIYRALASQALKGKVANLLKIVEKKTANKQPSRKEKA